MAITTAGMRALRAAATLADVVPTVRIRIRHDGRELCVVTRSTRTGEEAGPTLPACAFRRAVGHAWRLHRSGNLLRFWGMGDDGEPAVDIGLRPGDLVLPGEIYRFATFDGHFLFCFLTGLDVPSAERAVSEVLSTTKRCHDRPVDGQAPIGGRRVGFHDDPVTELTAVHTLCSEADVSAVAGIMGRLLEICVAAEAIADIEASAGSPS